MDGVVQRDPVRLWISRNLHVTAFLTAYFATTVAGNLLFTSAFGRDSLIASRFPVAFLAFPNTFTVGYWALLLCPFLMSPVLVSMTKRRVATWAGRVVDLVPEFRRLDYAIICVVFFGLVIRRLWLADAPALFSSGGNDVTSVEARFTIRERIGYFTLVPLQALLPYLTIYAMIRSIGSRERFWIFFSVVNTLLLSILLLLVNMKWPLLLFYISIVLTVFVYARRPPYAGTAIGAIFVFGAFLVVSAFVFRFAPGREMSPSDRPAFRQTVEQIIAAGRAAPAFAPSLLVSALNRTAIAYPYYYQVFTEQGPVCGGILAQARRHPSCRPSELVYATIFGRRTFGTDDFESQGTSPIAVHVSGYALGRWPVAMLALLAGSVILGFFAALPLDRSPVSSTLTILGAITAYHLSQIPGEGVIFYEHGLIWPALLILLYALWRKAAIALPASFLGRFAGRR
jgi:hypothetical protein